MNHDDQLISDLLRIFLDYHGAYDEHGNGMTEEEARNMVIEMIQHVKSQPSDLDPNSIPILRRSYEEHLKQREMILSFTKTLPPHSFTPPIP